MPTFIEWGEILGEWLEALIDWFATEGVSSLKTSFAYVVNFIQNLADWGVFLKESLSGLQDFMTGFKEGFIAFGQWLGEAAWAVWDYIEPARIAIMSFGKWLGEVGYKAWELLVKIFDRISVWVKRAGRWLGFGEQESGGEAPAFQTGGIVPSTGPALVHKGETVFPGGFAQESISVGRANIEKLNDIRFVLSAGFERMINQANGASSQGSSIIDDLLQLESA